MNRLWFQPPLVEVVISQPVKENIVDRDIYTGEVVSKDAVDVRSRVRGEIKDVPFKKKMIDGKEINLEGKEIAAGELLFVIDDAPFQANKQQAEGEEETWIAKKKAAKEIIKIYEPLVKKGTVATQELIKAIGTEGEAGGGIIAAKGKIMEAENNIKYCKNYLPIAGRIGLAMLTKGNIVNSGGQESLLATVRKTGPSISSMFSFPVNERALLNYQKLVLGKASKKEKKEEKLQVLVEQ